MCRRKSTILLNVYILLSYAAIGVVLGSAWALVEVGRHDYISLGFGVNAFLTFRAYASCGAAAGAAAGVVCLLFRWAVRSGRFWPRVIQALGLCVLEDTSAKRPRTFWPYLVCLAFILLLLVVRVFAVGGISSRAIQAVLPGAAFWCGAFAILRMILKRSHGFMALVTRSFLILLYIALVCLVLVGGSHTRMDASDPWGLVCLAVLAVLVITRELQLSCRPEIEAAKRSVGWIRRVLVPVLAIVVPLGLWVASPSVARAARRPANAWNVVLIGIDTLRWDHTDLVGLARNPRSLTPNLREWSAGGTVFEAAISQAPWTLPAFASILTGKYPHEHGAISMFGRLRKREPTLAEVLREAGYRTGAVVSGLFVNSNHGLAQGFDYFNEDNDLGEEAITSGAVSDLGIAFLRDHADERFFLFLHYFDPHSDYQDHQAWQFADGYRGPLKGKLGTFKELQRKRHVLGAPDIEYLTDLYAEEIAYTDREIGRFLQYARETGLDKKTMFVVVADHGEEFMEHGWIGHTVHLYEELIRVPLIIVLPGSIGAGKVVTDTVETRAVFSSILDGLGLPLPVPGENAPPSLLPMMRPVGAGGIATTREASESSPGTAYSSVWLTNALLGEKRATLSSLQTDRWKLIHDHGRDKKYLFDLSRDPREAADVTSQHPEKSADLFHQLDAWWRQMERHGADVPRTRQSQDDLEKLKSLGYL